MTQNFAPAFAPNNYTGEDVSFEEEYDFRRRQPTAQDIARRNDRPKLKQGEMGTNAFNEQGTKARLYRLVNGGKFCEVALVDFERRDYYLRKRTAAGQPVFYSRQPAPLLEAHSDPCPVDVGVGPCGRRLGSQVELLKHIKAAHHDEAPFYLSQQQLDLLAGKSMAVSGGISMTPSLPSGSAAAEDAAAAVVYPLAADQGWEDDAAPAPAPALALAAAVQPEPVKVRKPRWDARDTGPAKPRWIPASVPHLATCRYHGRMGRYGADCPACEELRLRNPATAAAVAVAG